MGWYMWQEVGVAAIVDNGRRLRLVGAIGVAAVGVVTLVRYHQSTCGL